MSLRTASIASFTAIDGLLQFACPARWVDASPHIGMKTRMWPVPHSSYPAMLDRIPVNVIDVPLKILVVANQVFPVSALPDIALTP